MSTQCLHTKMCAILIVLLISFIVGFGHADDKGSFFHITDPHWDFTYGGDDLSCNEKVEGHAIYGEYVCDPPWQLIQSSVEAMKRVNPTPDFILWTGDNILHTGDENLSIDINDELLRNLTQLLKDYFPDTPTYATFGNHDYFPDAQFPPYNSEIYNRTYEYWKEWILTTTDSQQEVFFRKGAFYTVKDQHGLRVIALNTNLYYRKNRITVSDDDPAGQFAWMEDILAKSRLLQEKVILTAHVPPGIEGGHAYGTRSMYEKFNGRFNEMILKYSDVIVGMHFGHEHTDNTRIYMKNGVPVVVLFLAPSVTPWMGRGPPHNPGFRMIHYNRTNGDHLDMVQYNMDLEESNKMKTSQWKIEYTATKDMHIPDITPASVNSFFTKTKDPRSKEFHDHYRWRTVSVREENPRICSGLCHSRIFCNFYEFDADDYLTCVDKVFSLTSGKDRQGVACWYILTFLMLSLLFT